eukprot:TRINITY_DN11648_c0_g1_i1.p3 TRINITY_DN11648_c0_g1~~TRINITY_DN11648_c0_g1_i1.p3  ORF type:complete len:102 (+),score=10.45 TRINITY_DN11648_c0_g1_i1:48-308(+)
MMLRNSQHLHLSHIQQSGIFGLLRAWCKIASAHKSALQRLLVHRARGPADTQLTGNLPGRGNAWQTSCPPVKLLKTVKLTLISRLY